MPLIGLVPIVDGWRNRTDTHVVLLESPSSQAAEAYRSMRTAVQFLGIDQPIGIIGVTSPGAGDGKTTTTANLAASFARAGQRVVILSGDLRRPRIHNFFAATNDTGLTSVILGELSVDDAIQDVEHVPLLRILASGPIPPNPAEVLSLDRVHTIVDAIALTTDIILIDCPPILPVTDALLISRIVDGMLVVASAGITKKRDLQHGANYFDRWELLSWEPSSTVYHNGLDTATTTATTTAMTIGPRRNRLTAQHDARRAEPA